MSEDQQAPEAEQTSTHSGDAGLPDAHEVPPETIEQIEAERAERLDPANRPEDAEIDNTVRTFDPGSGRFTDDPDYDPEDRPFAEDGSEAPEPAGGPDR